VPAALYRKSRRRYRGDCRNCDTANLPTRRVTDSGYVGWQGRLRAIGRAFGASAWASSQYGKAFMKSISSVILSGCWCTPIRAACGQLVGPAERSSGAGKVERQTPGAAAIAPHPSGGSAARFGAGAPHRSAPPPEGCSSAGS